LTVDVEVPDDDHSNKDQSNRGQDVRHEISQPRLNSDSILLLSRTVIVSLPVKIVLAESFFNGARSHLSDGCVTRPIHLRGTDGNMFFVDVEAKFVVALGAILERMR
jgi:hypothetical protein